MKLSESDQMARELRSRMAALGWRQYETAERLGRCRSWITKILGTPDRMTADAIRDIVKLLKPDIGTVLRWLGYTDQDILRFAKKEIYR